MGCLLQPPSGGCVLKHANTSSNSTDSSQPPSGGCVLKRGGRQTGLLNFDPAAFRRLCVETRRRTILSGLRTSRLQAAVC